MMIRESSHGYWTSSRSFLWVAAGATIGISNLSRVPYLMWEYGGLAFLLVYVAALVLIALPLLTTEWMIGRWMREDILSGFGRLVEAAQARRSWRMIGVMSLLGAVLILSYYSVIAGWSIAYAFRMSTGMFAGVSEQAATDTFLALVQDPERSLSWHTVFMVVVCVVVAHGFREGIERAAMRLMPAALLLAMALCAWAVTTINSAPVLDTLLAADFGKVGWRGLIEAMHQAFFTMSLGMGVMMSLGTNLPVAAPVQRLAFSLLLVNVAFSVIAGVAVFTVISGAGLTPVPGLALIFQQLPRSVPDSLGGTLFGVGFFSMLFMITLCSAIALLEPLTRYMMERWRWTRVFAAATAALLVWYLGLGTLLSFSLFQNFDWLGRNFFEWMQFLTASLLAPMTGLAISVFIVSVAPKELARAIWGQRDRWLFGGWFFTLRYPARIGLIVVMIYATGLLTRVVSFWTTAP